MNPSLDIEAFKKLLAAGAPAILLDVRRRADYDANPQKIAGADWHDPETVGEWAARLPAGGQAVAYCVKGGSVSQSVAERLRAEGIDAAFLVGGLKAWEESGNPVVPAPPLGRR